MTPSHIIVLVALSLSLPVTGLASSREFIENYTYHAGESDSKLTCRIVSLIEVKRLLLEKIGTYLESRTEIQNFALEKDEIVTLTAGIVKLEILEEKWNGEQYSLTARIEAIPEEITQAINDLKNQKVKMENIRKLQAINDESIEQLREMQARMQQLQSDLLSINQDAKANQTILNGWGLFEKSVQLRQSGKTREAIETLNVVIRNNPTHLAYLERGTAFLEAGLFDAAIADLTEVLKIQPDMRGALFHRGLAYHRSGNKAYGRRDMEKAAELGNSWAKKWLKDHPPGDGRGKRNPRSS